MPLILNEHRNVSCPTNSTGNDFLLRFPVRVIFLEFYSIACNIVTSRAFQFVPSGSSREFTISSFAESSPRPFAKEVRKKRRSRVKLMIIANHSNSRPIHHGLVCHGRLFARLLPISKLCTRFCVLSQFRNELIFDNSDFASL